MVNMKHRPMRTREDLFAIAENLLENIVRQGMPIEKSGVVVQTINTCRAIIADQETADLSARLIALEELVNGKQRERCDSEEDTGSRGADAPDGTADASGV